ncbi:hypothetical protein SANTM175S_04983 [Streptomyces antimycoticus]
MAEDFARERGWAMDPVHRLNARQVAIQALGRRFGVELEKPERGWETDYQLVMDVPEAFREFVRQAEPTADRDLSIVLRDAYARFLSGEWVPASRTGPGRPVRRQGPLDGPGEPEGVGAGQEGRRGPGADRGPRLPPGPDTGCSGGDRRGV